MDKKNKLILKNIKKSLIASCQPVPNGPLDTPSFVLASAKASLIGGAKALRIEGFKNLKIIKKNIGDPVIGIKKRVSEKKCFVSASLRTGNSSNNSAGLMSCSFILYQAKLKILALPYSQNLGKD